MSEPDETENSNIDSELMNRDILNSSPDDFLLTIGISIIGLSKDIKGWTQLIGIQMDQIRADNIEAPVDMSKRMMQKIAADTLKIRKLVNLMQEYAGQLRRQNTDDDQM